MRPDPYKQERSRRYLAKQRAKGGSTQAPAVSPAKSKQQQWLASLPSNAFRFSSSEGASDGLSPLDASEDPERQFDFDNAQQLDDMLKDFSLALNAQEQLTPAVGTSPKSRTCGEERHLLGSGPFSPLYDRLTRLDISLIESKLAKTSICAAELAGLPSWFRDEWNRQALNPSPPSGTPSPPPSGGAAAARPQPSPSQRRISVAAVEKRTSTTLIQRDDDPASPSSSHKAVGDDDGAPRVPLLSPEAQHTVPPQASSAKAKLDLECWLDEMLE